MINRILSRLLGPAARAVGPAALLALSAFLSACNGFSADDARPASAGSGRDELTRFAERYGTASSQGSPGYRIGPQDVLEVTVFKAPDLSKSVQVAEAGTINLPLVGDIPAAGKTASALEHDIQGRLGARYMKSPQVTVFVKEYNSQRVTIEGAVRKPGVYPLRGGDTLMQTIARAEGLDREVSSTNVAIFRDNGRQVIRYDVDQIRGGSASDPEVRMGDVIVVEDSSMKTTFNYLKALTPLASPLAIIATTL